MSRTTTPTRSSLRSIVSSLSVPLSVPDHGRLTNGGSRNGRHASGIYDLCYGDGTPITPEASLRRPYFRPYSSPNLVSR
jgi:hypothetical protein